MSTHKICFRLWLLTAFDRLFHSIDIYLMVWFFSPILLQLLLSMRTANFVVQNWKEKCMENENRKEKKRKIIFEWNYESAWIIWAARMWTSSNEAKDRNARQVIWKERKALRRVSVCVGENRLDMVHVWHV